VTEVVRLAGLTKDYGRHRALDAVDLSVEPGEVLGYLGPNGAGKTTTIRILVGLLRPTSGSVQIFGLDPWRASLPIHARIGYVPGELHLYERLTGYETIEYFASLRAGRATHRDRGTDLHSARTLAERFDLDLTRRVRALSRGNKQKLAIVQAFMSRPDLVLLDEPTSGLDPIVQQEFHVLLRELTDRGGTALLSSHVLDEVQRLADRVGIIRAGHLVAVERLELLRSRALHKVEARLGTNVRHDYFTQIPGIRDLSLEHGVMRCGVPEASLDKMIKALGQLQILDIAITEADLEEMFLTFYGSTEADVV